MRANLSLPQMVDLALGTPEVGAVNFNVLHTLLHALIQKLDLTEARAVINEEDREFLAKKQYEHEQVTEAATDDGAKSVADSGIDGTSVAAGSNNGRESSASKRSTTTVFKSPYHQLEEKVSKLEQELELLNGLPSNNELLEKMRYRGDGERIRPMSDMWQTMQISKKVDANEEGVGKLMSLVEDLMNELTTVKEANDKLKSQLNEMSPANQLKDLEERMKKLEELMNALNDRVSGIDEAVFVTWQGLEESLKGIRQELEPKERVVIEMANQTDPIPRTPTPQIPRTPTPTPKPESRPPSVSPPSRPPSSKHSRTSTPGPSQELQELLERLGHLTNKHDKLQTQVDDIEEELKKKANKDDLVGLGSGPSPEVPEDLLDQMKSMMDEIEHLKQARNKIAALQLQLEELEKVKQDVGETQQKQEDADSQIRELQANIKEAMGGLAERVRSVAELASAAAMPEDMLHDALCTYVEEYKEALNLPAVVSEEDKSIVLTLKDRESMAKLIRKNLDDHLVTSRKSVTPTPITPVPVTPGPLVPVEEPPPPPEPLPAIEAPSRDREDFLEQIMKIQKLENDLHAKAEKIMDIDLQVQALMQDSGRHLDRVKSKVKHLERELTEIRIEQGKNVVGRVLSDTSNRNDSVSMDSDALSRMQQVLLNLQAELERVNSACNQLVADTENNQKSIDELFNLTRSLDEVKADKDFVQSEVNVKADKRHLDTKVNRNLFDSTTDELNKMIADLLRKLGGQEEEWKKLMGDLSSDLDGKLDRLEFGPIRNELERQLKALARQLKNMDFLRDSTEDDAAGIRKQLAQRYHCISCDRQVEMMPQGPIPAIPATQGLPPTRSTRPYTTYELDQIRQSTKNQVQCTKYAMYNNNSMGAFEAAILGRTNFDRLMYERYKDRMRLKDCRNTLFRFVPQLRPFYKAAVRSSYNAQQVEVMDLYSTTRACGGSHTTTYPHRRVTRATALNNYFREEGSATAPPVRDEMDIMGADGHIYRGRFDDQRLPDLPQTAPGMVNTTGRGSSPQRQPMEGPAPNQGPHRPNTPHSARTAPAQRVQSAGTSSRRPGSAAAHVQSSGRDDTDSQPGALPHTTTPVPPNVS